jgi:hypothetical protein
LHVAKKKARKSSRKKARKSSRKKSKARKSTKRSRAAKKAARTRAEKKAKRSAAAKKAARSRKRKKSKHAKAEKKSRRRKKKAKGGKKRRRRGGKRKARKASAKKRRRSSKKRRRASSKKRSRRSAKKRARRGGKKRGRGGKKRRRSSPAQRERKAYLKQRRYEKDLAKKVVKNQRKRAKKDREIARLEKRIARLQAAEAARRHRRAPRRGRKHGHARAANPIGSSDGMEFLAGVLGAVAGGALSLITDRYASSHALTTGSSGSGYADAPASGQVYNSQGPNTPIWSSWSRMLWAAGAILAPLGISAVVPDKAPHAKSFFQIMFFGALTVTGTKVAADGMSSLLGSTAFGARLLAPEGAAAAQLGAQGGSNATQLPSVDLSQATNAAGSTVKQQAGQGNVFVAGNSPRKQLTGAVSPTSVQQPLNAGSTGAYVPTTGGGGGVLNAPPQPVGTRTPVPVGPELPTPVSPSPGPSLPGNQTGPMCLGCALPQHPGRGCGESDSVDDGFDPFDPAGESASDATSDGDGEVH